VRRRRKQLRPFEEEMAKHTEKAEELEAELKEKKKRGRGSMGSSADFATLRPSD